MKKHYLLSGINFIWIIVIFILCTMPSQDIPNPGINIPHLDKVVHFGMFFVLSVLMRWELEYRGHWSLRTIYIFVIGISLLYGGALEILQHYFFSREGDTWDLLADVAGGIAGCLLYPIVRKLKDRFLNRKRSPK